GTSSSFTVPFVDVRHVSGLHRVFQLETDHAAGMATRVQSEPVRPAVPSAGAHVVLVQHLLATLATVARTVNAFQAAISRPARMFVATTQYWWTHGARVTSVLMASVSDAIVARVSASGDTVTQSLGTLPASKTIKV